jgi:hypothetical protein
MAHHYFVETVFIFAQFLMALLVYLIPGIIKKKRKKLNPSLLYGDVLV